MAAAFLGIDVGTSATRVSLIDAEGTLLAGASRDHPTASDGGDGYEQDPKDWLEGLRAALAETAGSGPPPTAIGICGQTPTLVLVDAAGRPVRPALTWRDARAIAEADELAERLGDPRPLVGTSLAWSAVNMPAKLLWLARHEPSSLERTRWLLQPKDLVGLELTGVAISDPWSTKGICSVEDGNPAETVLAACCWPTTACPTTAPAWSASGTVTEEASRRYGVPAGIPVSVGWSDALAQVLASGCFLRRSAFFFSGTSAIVGAPVPGPGFVGAGLFDVPTSCSPVGLCYGPTQSSGASLAWAARLLGCKTEDLAGLAARSRGEVPAFVPYLRGERAPLWDPEVRALFLGVGDEHGPAEFARAVVEGVLLSARHVLDLVESATAQEVADIEVVGRGVGDEAWESFARASLGATLHLHPDADMSARGAAMLGAAASGLALGEAAARLADDARVDRPSPGEVAASRARSERYGRASAVATGWRSARGGERRDRDGSCRR